MDNKNLVLKEFFEQPYKEFHIRLLARKTGLNPNTIINITNTLQADNLVHKNKEEETNRVIIKANQTNQLFRIKKQAYNIEKIFRSGLIQFLNETAGYPTIILFGSYAKAENDARSDIDLFIITDEKKEPDLSRFEKQLGAEIQTFTHTKAEFKKLKEKNKELVNNVINGIVLTGYLEVL